MLLDEATSALDTVNEKVVQKALDDIIHNKDSSAMSINIAHRISTIRDSDHLYVFNKGKIIEDGNYDNLMKKRGYFYKLETGNKK